MHAYIAIRVSSVKEINCYGHTRLVFKTFFSFIMKGFSIYCSYQFIEKKYVFSTLSPCGLSLIKSKLHYREIDFHKQNFLSF